MAFNPLAEKRGPRLGDAASLWNFTPSPGWTKEEVQILKLCLMKHGVGKWVQILGDGLLPGKLIQQLNGQTQRLLGQQSLAAYTGLQVDVDRIRTDNEARTDAERKQGLIINTGPNLTKQMKQKLQEEAKVKYGLTAEQVKEVEEQIEELRAGMRKDAAPPAPAASGVSLMGADPATLSKEQKVALLRRLHGQLVAVHSQLVKARQPGAAPVQQQAPAATAAAAPAKGGEPRPSNSNAENEPAAANTDSMEVDPPAPATTAAALPAGAPAPLGRAAAGSQGAKRKARTPKSKRQATPDSGDSDGDWMPAAGGKRRGKRAAQGREGQDSGLAGTEESAADTIAAANVATLVEMGFAARQAQQALAECGQDVEAALEWLTENCI